MGVGQDVCFRRNSVLRATEDPPQTGLIVEKILTVVAVPGPGPRSQPFPEPRCLPSVWSFLSDIPGSDLPPSEGCVSPQGSPAEGVSHRHPWARAEVHSDQGISPLGVPGDE